MSNRRPRLFFTRPDKQGRAAAPHFFFAVFTPFRETFSSFIVSAENYCSPAAVENAYLFPASIVFQSYLNIIKQFFPSPLRGEGQGGGDYCLCYFQMLSPSPNPLPSREGECWGPRDIKDIAETRN